MSSMAACWVSLAHRSRCRRRQDWRSTSSLWMSRPKRSSKDISLELLVVSCCSKAVAIPRRRSSCSCCSSGWVSIGSSGEVSGTAHVVVSGYRGGSRCRRRRRDDERSHGAVAVSPELESALAGLLESAGAEVMGQAQDPKRRAQRLFRVNSSCCLLTEYGCGGRSDRLGTLEKPLVAQLDDGAVPIRPVARFRDEPPRSRSSRVPRNCLAAVVDLDRMCGDPKIHALADEAVRNGVVPALVLDVVIKEHLGALPGGVLVAVRRQRPQRRLLEIMETTPASPDLARELPVVVALELLLQRHVQIAEASAGVPEAGAHGGFVVAVARAR